MGRALLPRQSVGHGVDNKKSLFVEARIVNHLLESTPGGSTDAAKRGNDRVAESTFASRLLQFASREWSHAMKEFVAILMVMGFVPLAQALRCNRQTTLRQPLWWALLAWAAWNYVAWCRVFLAEEQRVAVYVALSLTGCAGIAVLGARRPGVTAWNFVVVGLLAVLLLPVINGLGELRLEPAQQLFLSVTLVVPILNYLPTRLGPGMVLMAVGCGIEFVPLLHGSASQPWLGLLFVAFGPWVGWGILKRGFVTSEFDRVWLDYRDRFGFVWGQRIREQFNRAAYHSDWPVVLRWQGLQAKSDQPLPDSAELLSMLRAVLKRFDSEEKQPLSS